MCRGVRMCDGDQAQLSQDPELSGLYIMLDRVDVHCIWVSGLSILYSPHHFPFLFTGRYINIVFAG